MSSFPANFNLLVAQSTRLRPILDVAQELGLSPDDVDLYGRYKAKIDLRVMDRLGTPKGKLILVTAMTPTAAGEGKTTITIGLTQGLCRLWARCSA
jgi:formate--tetrahydrofolate ligase